jgi:hypothetical protein
MFDDMPMLEAIDRRIAEAVNLCRDELAVYDSQQLEDAIRCLEGARSFLADLARRGAA